MLSEERAGILDEECGIAALWLTTSATGELLLDALDALQHRGQEAAGMSALFHRGAQAPPLKTIKAPGRVEGLRACFASSDLSRAEPPVAMLGHVRYSTSAGRSMACAQPLVRQTRYGPVSLAHNGHITNAAQLRAEMDIVTDEQASTDTSVLLDLLEHSTRPTLLDALHESIARLEGAFSMVLLHEEEGLLAWRDRHGVRPLVHGRVRGEDGVEGWMLASETVAFAHVEVLSEIEELPAGGLWQMRVGARAPKIGSWLERGSAPAASVMNCLFELVYFASPRSVVFDVNVQRARESMGRALYIEHASSLPDDIDMVLAVPESSRAAALGFAHEARLPFVDAITRREESLKRSFLEPDTKSREAVASTKFEVHEALVTGKRVVVIDDSLVRGTTAKEVVKLLRRAEVERIYLCIASAPIVSPCYYGIDTPQREELLAAAEERAALGRTLGVELLCYLSLEGLKEAARRGGEGFCDACFSGNYL